LHLLFNLVWIRLHQVASQIVDGASIPLKPKVVDFVQSSFLSNTIVSVKLGNQEQPTIRSDLTATKISSDLAASKLTKLIRSGLQLCFCRDHALKL